MDKREFTQELDPEAMKKVQADFNKEFADNPEGVKEIIHRVTLRITDDFHREVFGHGLDIEEG